MLDERLAGQDPATVLGSDGLLGELKKALAERMLNAEMDVHLDSPAEQDAGNHRHGSSQKTVLSGDGALELSIPRDRHGRFDPALIANYQRRFPGFDDTIIARYARAMSTRDIQGHVGERYGITLSPDLVSAVTDSVIDEVRAWQSRPLESTYALVFFDALRVKIRDEGLVRNQAVYLAMGMRCSGHQDILGLWIEQTEGAKFSLRVMNELRSRGLNDVLIAGVDGLKGFPEAITAVFPDTGVQTRMVHLIRNAMQLASWQQRKALAQALKAPLPGRQRRGRRARFERVRARRVGPAVSHRRTERAPALGTGDAVLRLRARGSKEALHHQRDRASAQPPSLPTSLRHRTPLELL